VDLGVSETIVDSLDECGLGGLQDGPETLDSSSKLFLDPSSHLSSKESGHELGDLNIPVHLKLHPPMQVERIFEFLLSLLIPNVLHQ
jgi:hypothetical protein